MWKLRSAFGVSAEDLLKVGLLLLSAVLIVWLSKVFFPCFDAYTMVEHCPMLSLQRLAILCTVQESFSTAKRGCPKNYQPSEIKALGRGLKSGVAIPSVD